MEVRLLGPLVVEGNGAQAPLGGRVGSLRVRGRLGGSSELPANDAPFLKPAGNGAVETSALSAAMESGAPAASARSTASRRSAVRLDGRATPIILAFRGETTKRN